MKAEALELWLKGLSVKQIAEWLGISEKTVKRYIKDPLAGVRKRGRKKKDRTASLPEDLQARLRALLLDTNTEKGKKRTHSLRRIYSLLELDLKLAGINTLWTFYRTVEDFVVKEWGSWEKLEVVRKGIKEAPRISRGVVIREKGVIEIDATDIQHDNILYPTMFAIETYSMRVIGFYHVAGRDKDRKSKYYNTHFSSLDVGKFLMELFLTYGLPAKVKVDNARINISEYIKQSLEELGVELVTTTPGRPNQKLIERVIREIKDVVRTVKAETVDDRIRQAVETYNKSPHRFMHFQEDVVPESIPLEGFVKENEDKIRRAFMERAVRKVTNNIIRWDNLLYEFYMPADAYKGLGRKRKTPTVLCKRFLDDITRLEVYGEKGEYLGIARLISTELPATETIDYKQHKLREKRIKRREEKLREELREIHEARVSTEAQEEDLLCLLSNPAPKPEPEKAQEEEWDILKIFGGG